MNSSVVTTSLCVALLILSACGDDDIRSIPDAMPDATTDAMADATSDAMVDGAVDGTVPDATVRDAGGPGGGDGLLISEVSTQPNSDEYVEIYNPTDTEIDLSNVYLTDNSAYTRFAAGMMWSPDGTPGTDWLIGFPSGATLGAGAVAMIAFGSSTRPGGMAGVRDLDFEMRDDFVRCPDFMATGFDGAEDDEIRCGGAAIPLMRNPMNAGAGNNAGQMISNSREMVMLFQWTGGLVEDLDYVIWGSDTDSATRVDKTMVAGYQPDTAIATQNTNAPTPPSGTTALVRCDSSEPSEVTTGGNGPTGHDETSEGFSSAWMESTRSAGTLNPCLSGS